MAEIECRRGLLQFLTTHPNIPYFGDGREELLHVFLLYAKLNGMKMHGNSVLTLFSGDYDKQNALHACTKGMGILTHAEYILALDPLEPLYRNFRSTVLLIASWKSLHTERYEEALESVKSMMEVLEGQVERLHEGNSLLNDNNEKFNRCNADYLEAKLIYCKLIELINPSRSVIIMSDVLQTTCKCNMIALNGEAILLYLLVQQKLHLCDVEPCRRLVYNVYDVGRTLAFPQLERSAKVAISFLGKN